MSLPVSLDMTREQTTSEGTGPFVLGGRWNNEFLPFPASGGPYVFRIKDPQNGKWVLFQGMVETVLGVHRATVTTVLKNSDGGTTMFNFGAGIKEISAVAPAVLLNAITTFLDTGGGADALAASVSAVIGNLGDLTAVVGALNAASLGGMLTITEDRVYYVDTVSGNDTNDGLTVLNAFATFDKAIQVVRAQVVMASVTIQCVETSIVLDAPISISFFGPGQLVLAGDSAAGTAISCPTVPVTVSLNGISGSIILQDLILSNGLADVLSINNCAYVSLTGSFMEFGAVGVSGGAHIQLFRSTLILSSDYTISAHAASHISMNDSRLEVNGAAVTLTATPAFTAFLNMAGASQAFFLGAAFTGSATGSYYNVTENSLLKLFGVTLPGSSAGTTATGGQVFS